MRVSLPNPDVLDVCEHLSLQHRSGREGEGGDQIGGVAGMSELDGGMNPPYPPSVVDCIQYIQSSIPVSPPLTSSPPRISRYRPSLPSHRHRHKADLLSVP